MKWKLAEYYNICIFTIEGRRAKSKKWSGPQEMKQLIFNRSTTIFSILGLIFDRMQIWNRNKKSYYIVFEQDFVLCLNL